MPERKFAVEFRYAVTGTVHCFLVPDSPLIGGRSLCGHMHRDRTILVGADRGPVCLLCKKSEFYRDRELRA